MLARLSCEGFRNLASTDWRPGPGRHLIVGANGAGKTSLLEALYLVATTRSFRTPRVEECVTRDLDAFRVHGEFEAAARVALEVGWSRFEGRRRTLNGGEASLTEYLDVQPVVAWSSADVEVLAGAPGARRRLLDQGIVTLRPGSVATLTRYRRTLRQKRELLVVDGSGLDAWNDLLAEAAHDLQRLRSRYVDLLGVELDRIASESRLDLQPITVLYRPSPADGPSGVEALRAGLEEVRAAERRRRMPLAGPHRDELEIRLGGEELRRVASAGERKAAGLLLLAARRAVFAAAGRDPVVLVDDADAELDPRRLAHLWEVFAEASQLFATSSRPAVWESLSTDASWSMEAGRLGSDDRPVEKEKGTS